MKKQFLFLFTTILCLYAPLSLAQALKQILPSVTVVKPKAEPIQDNFVVSGTLVAREEVLVNHEVDGLRILEILVEEGDKVQKGQVLLRLSQENLKILIDQNEANMQKALSGEAQAKNAIPSHEAAFLEAKNALERARSLFSKNDIAESLLDQRVAAFRGAEARLLQSRDGLKIAQSDFKLIKAQRADLDLRLARTEIKAPMAGIISRRTAKIGQIVPGLQAPPSEPLFRLIANGAIELEAEALETRLKALKIGQPVVVSSGVIENIKGTLRLLPSEVDKNTRLGRLRITIDGEASLRVGAYGRAVVTVQDKQAITVPVTAVNFLNNGQTTLQIVKNGKVETKKITTGIKALGVIEVTSPLSVEEQVVLRAGPFLRDGDEVQVKLEEKAGDKK